MGRVSTQRVGGRRVASEAVLRVVHRYATSLVRRAGGESNQVGVARRELLSHRFDPGADALEGVAKPQRDKDVQTASTAGLGISPHTSLFECLVQPQRRLPHGIE